MVEKAKSVLIIGVGTQIGLTIIRSLGSKGITVYSVSKARTDIGTYSRYLTKNFCIPYSIISETSDYIQQLLRILEKYRVDYVITINERFMLALNKYRVDIEQFSKLLIPTDDVLRVVLNKGMTTMIAKKLDIPVPGSIIFENLEQLNQLGQLRFPVIVKPSNRYYLEHDLRQFDFRIKFFKEQQSISEFLESYFKRLNPRTFSLLIQEFCDGEEIGFPIIMRKGQCITCFQYCILMNSPPYGGAPVYRQSMEVDPELKEYSTRLLQEINFEGVAEIDYIRDTKDNKIKLLEINGRFWGTLPITVKSGMDFPYIFYQSVENSNPININQHYKTGVKCRLLGGYTNAILDILFSGNEDNFSGQKFSKFKSVSDYIMSFSPFVKNDIASMNDPLPGIIDFLFMASKPFQSVVKHLRME